jgi:hypothetical protein
MGLPVCINLDNKKNLLQKPSQKYLPNPHVSDRPVRQLRRGCGWGVWRGARGRPPRSCTPRRGTRRGGRWAAPWDPAQRWTTSCSLSLLWCSFVVVTVRQIYTILPSSSSKQLLLNSCCSWYLCDHEL